MGKVKSAVRYIINATPKSSDSVDAFTIKTGIAAIYSNEEIYVYGDLDKSAILALEDNFHVDDDLSDLASLEA